MRQHAQTRTECGTSRHGGRLPKPAKFCKQDRSRLAEPRRRRKSRSRTSDVMSFPYMRAGCMIVRAYVRRSIGETIAGRAVVVRE